MNNEPEVVSQWSRVVFDIEANGLLDATTIWCISMLDLDTGEVKCFAGDSEVQQASQLLRDARVKIAHNMCGYDSLVIHRVTGIDIEQTGKCIDTLILSRLFFPELQGHRIEDWGRRLNLPKMDFRQASIDAGLINKDDPKGAEFLVPSDVMYDYCDQDARIGRKVWSALCHRLKEAGYNINDCITGLPYRLEYAAQREMTLQAERGFPFRLDHARRLLYRMHQAKGVIDAKVGPMFPPRVVAIGNPVAKPLKADGTPSAMVNKHWDEEKPPEIGGTFTRIKYEPVNLGSDHQVKGALLKLGWKPDEYTEKGSPRLTETSLMAWGGRVGYLMARRLMYRHRIGLVEGLVEAVRPDCRVSAGGIAQGAITGRVTHRTVANIPRTTSPMGKAIRNLFWCGPDKVQVGCDASGLELRCLAHYLNNPQVTEEILNGDSKQGTDIHTRNATAVGVDRDCVKTITYGWLYGAGDGKLGRITLDSTVGDWHGTDVEGTAVRAAMLERMDAGPLLEKVAYEAESGYIKALDGRYIPIRSDHAALNTLLQSCGALIMKAAYLRMCSLIDQHPEWGAEMLCFYHK